MSKLSDMFKAIAEVINDLTAPKERAVSISEVFQGLQDQLDKTPALDESGQPKEGTSSGYVLDAYIEGTSIFAVVTKEDGKLYKVPVSVDANGNIVTGEYSEVTMEFAPVSAPSPDNTVRQVQVKRMADGQVRWFAVPACTAVVNRSGEIDSKALFDSFVSHIERGGEYPELDFYHMGERLVLGKADWVAREGVTYCASGLFYDTDIAQAAIKALEADPNFWGLSIAYIPTDYPEELRLKDGVRIPVFNSGINRYISLLPENTAASILTSISTQEVNRMNEKVTEALKKLTGEDTALFDAIALKLDSVNRNAEGMISRDATPAPAAQEPVAPVVEARALTNDDVTMILASPEFEVKVSEIFKKLMDANSSPDAVQENKVAATPAPEAHAKDELSDKVDKLLEQVAELSKSRDASLQEVLDDLPAKVTRQRIVRPRSASLMPNDVRSPKVDMSALAARTLEKMNAREQ